jgi:hypothetical protein
MGSVPVFMAGFEIGRECGGVNSDLVRLPVPFLVFD